MRLQRLFITSALLLLFILIVAACCPIPVPRESIKWPGCEFTITDEAGRPLEKVPPDACHSRLAASGPEAVATVDGPVLRRFKRNRRRGAAFCANHLMGLPCGARSA